jgi:hypothetical protein
MTDDRTMRRIRALLTKAESTEYPEEAAAFMEKVAALVAEHRIDQALIWAEVRDETPIQHEIVVAAPYVARKRLLVSGVADALGCQAIAGLPHPDGERVAVIGFRSDVEHVNVLVASLLVQMTSALLEAEAATPGMQRTARTAWRRSFITAYADRVSSRLRQAFKARTEETVSVESSVALVLADRTQEVRREVRKRYPNLRSIPVGQSSSAAGIRSGYAAGDRADIGHRSVDNRRELTGRSQR